MNHYELAKICERSYTSSSFSARGDVEVLVEDHGACYVVAVRGTEARDLWTQRDTFRWRNLLSRKQWRNWWGAVQDISRDLTAWPTYSNQLNGRFHTGFLRGANAVSSYLLVAYRLDKPVIVTGHSLGGGVALILALLLRKAHVNVRECVIFGTPKVICRKSQAVCMGLNLTGYRYGNDFVTTVPCCIWDYEHPNYPWQLGGYGGEPNWNDHAIGAYVTALAPSNEE